MARRRRDHLGGVTLDHVARSAIDHAQDQRSDLFVWLSQNRKEFAARRHEHTWAAWAQAFEERGIRTNAAGPVNARTVKLTWWKVRRLHGGPLGEPVLSAEKAKVRKRRSPRRVTVRAPEPPPGPGEVAAGVRLTEQPPAPVAADNDPIASIMAELRKDDAWRS